MSKQQLGVLWEVETEQIEISEALEGGSTTFRKTFQKMGIFWTVTMKRRRMLLEFTMTETEMLDALKHGTMSHNNGKSPTSYMNFYCLYIENHIDGKYCS